ncbi:hypothetical protein WISP_94294 [Willisornis vidua]|uniref:Uncharacterized protein n=1 Tax=Willisornis vidua TaxID=1566151 RepID=A0ABQ9D0P8_9PASS|nr:hypothetical protein WISP_94294 [Willisornis vidua]
MRLKGCLQSGNQGVMAAHCQKQKVWKYPPRSTDCPSPSGQQPYLYHIGHYSQLYIISKHAESTRHLIIQFINKDVEEYWTQYQAPWYNTSLMGSNFLSKIREELSLKTKSSSEHLYHRKGDSQGSHYPEFILELSISRRSEQGLLVEVFWKPSLGVDDVEWHGKLEDMDQYLKNFPPPMMWKFTPEQLQDPVRERRNHIFLILVEILGLEVDDLVKEKQPKSNLKECISRKPHFRVFHLLCTHRIGFSVEASAKVRSLELSTSRTKPQLYGLKLSSLLVGKIFFDNLLKTSSRSLQPVVGVLHARARDAADYDLKPGRRREDNDSECPGKAEWYCSLPALAAGLGTLEITQQRIASTWRQHSQQSLHPRAPASFSPEGLATY